MSRLFTQRVAVLTTALVLGVCAIALSGVAVQASDAVSTSTGSGTSTSTTSSTASGSGSASTSTPATVLTAVPGGCGSNAITLFWPSLNGVVLSYYLTREDTVIYEGSASQYVDLVAAGTTHQYRLSGRGSGGVTVSAVASAKAPLACATTASTTPGTGAGTTATSTTATTPSTTNTATPTTPGTASTTPVATTPSATTTSPATVVATTTTLNMPQPPAPLTRFTATSTLPGIIALQWLGGTSASSVVLERKLSTVASYVVRSRVSATAGGYVDDDVTAGAPYDYRARVCQGDLCSSFVYLVQVISRTAPVPQAVVATTTVPVVNHPATTTPPIPLPQPTPIPVAPKTPEPVKPPVTTPKPKPPSPARATTTSLVSLSSTTVTFSGAPVAAPTTSAPALATTTLIANHLEAAARAVGEVSTSLTATRAALTKITNDKVEEIVQNRAQTDQPVDMEKLFAKREKALASIDKKLATAPSLSGAEVQALATSVTADIASLHEGTGTPPSSSTDTRVQTTLNTLATTIDQQAPILAAQNAAQLYKDSNGDGISDYESAQVYHLDPVKPSPVSVVEGKTLTAADKVLLGYDPAQKDLVKVTYQQPASSSAPVIASYVVKEVKVTETKKTMFKGAALPNSFVTLYIYSTPIIVTVKTDAQGQWSYTLDKELESGKHTVYTATVDNSGNIVARSTAIPFTRTALAASLDAPLPPPTSDVAKPGLLGSNTPYVLVAFASGAAIIIGVMLLLAGRAKKEDVPTA